ncbi:diguanylate cyclase (plasmid) [Burkholderia sp. MBR-1]|nr:diguanylate cyclase [Burkholderia sp. MBR-1]
MAETDVLTGLPNRRGLMTHLSGIASSADGADELGVLCLDLDQFKFINDRHGNDVGDNVLRRVAGRLAKEVGDAGFLARTRCDEFAVVLGGRSVNTVAEELATRILRIFHRPLGIQGDSHQMRVSIGIAVCEVSPGCETEVVKKAGMAMYEARAIGAKERRSIVCVYTAELPERMKRLFESEQVLRYALTGGHAWVCYRRVERPDCPGLVGYAAGVRWDEGGRTVEDILLLASETSSTALADDYARCVLRQVFSDWHKWREDAAIPPFLLVALPVSAILLPDFVYLVRDLVAEHGVDRGGVGIEVVSGDLQSLPMIDPDVVDELRLAGVLLIMRGTLPALTFSALKSTGWDGIKLPEELMRVAAANARAAAIASSVVRLGLSFGWRVFVDDESERIDTAWLTEFTQLERIARQMVRPPGHHRP